MDAILTRKPIYPESSLKNFREKIGNAGAVVNFTGHVRSDDTSDDPIRSLHLQSHPILTREGLISSIDAALQRWPLTNTLVIHRVGDIAPGDVIVLVATAARHRRDAFEAADYLMDYLKTKAVLWKREERASGRAWIEPRLQDYNDAERWLEKERIRKCPV